VFIKLRSGLSLALVALLGGPVLPLGAQPPRFPTFPIPVNSGIRQVLLISIDGMHQVDFVNCSKGISTVNGGQPYCPTLAALSQNGISYTNASTTKPSDSFPGSSALATG
jgi:hypothetical protein